MKNRIKNIHFVGIGGSGMCGIAEVLHNEGYRISGSDVNDSSTVKRLRQLGVKVFIGHAVDNIKHADAVAVSTAIKKDNPEVLAARERHIPVVPRAHMLAELMRGRQGIAVAGSHGKTTTTSLITSILAEAGLDPTFVIGGRLNSAGANARLGSGQYIVVEADESDASFLNLLPVMSVVTNIDADHMETYDYDTDRLHQAFINFLLRMPFYGVSVVCIEDEGVRAILPHISTTVKTYGFTEEAQVRAVNMQVDGECMRFVVQRKAGGKEVQKSDMSIQLNLPGKHNVLNALAAIAIADELGVADRAIQSALAAFKGVGRRFQRYGDFQIPQGGSFTLIEDYGHHPTEMSATIEAARGAFAGRRLVIVFQPHRYTRTRDCFEDFVQVLGQADAVYISEVYAAGEQPIVAADGRALTRALRVAQRVEPVFVADIREVPAAIKASLQDQDVVIFMGAGSINTAAKLMAKSFSNKEDV